jgi:hypothetical protein
MGCRAEIDLGPALQQADALPTEQRRTLRATPHPTELRRTLLSHAAPFLHFYSNAIQNKQYFLPVLLTFNLFLFAGFAAEG